MDVQRKLLLLELYESYWLMLPSEIQEYILVFKINQDVIDDRKKEKTVMLCKEIVQRRKLQEAWGLGPIRCRIIKCKKCTEGALGKIPLQFKFCKYVLHFKLHGVYTDLSNVKKIVFLGNDVPSALHRMNHVKSFL